MMEKNKNIGLLKLIKKFGSAKEVYTRINCDQGNFSKWLNGKSKIPLNKSLELMLLYGDGLRLSELKPEMKRSLSEDKAVNRLLEDFCDG